VTYLPGIIAPNSLVLENNFRGWYNGLQTHLTKRLSSGLSFNAAYTWSKAIDYRSNNYLNYSLDDPFNLAYFERSGGLQSDFRFRGLVVIFAAVEVFESA
jgi:hypothetical protein